MVTHSIGLKSMERIFDTVTCNIDAVNRFFEYVKNNETKETTIKTELKTEFI